MYWSRLSWYGYQAAETMRRAERRYGYPEQLGITHLALQYLDQLSGGQRQLRGLAHRFRFVALNFCCWMSRSARWI